MLNVKVEDAQSSRIIEGLEFIEKRNFDNSTRCVAVRVQEEVTVNGKNRLTQDWLIIRPKRHSRVYVMNETGKTVSIHKMEGAGGGDCRASIEMTKVILLNAGEKITCNACNQDIARAKVDLTSLDIKHASNYEFMGDKKCTENGDHHSILVAEKAMKMRIGTEQYVRDYL